MRIKLFGLILIICLLIISSISFGAAAEQNKNIADKIGDFFKNFFNSFEGSITGHLVRLGGYCSSTSDCENGVCINSKCCKVDAQGNAVIPYVCYPEEPATKKANGEICSSDAECSSNNCECVGPLCTGKYICCPVGAYCCAADSDCGVGMVCKNQDCFKKDGMPCESGYKCASGNCMHSICCAAGKHCCDSSDDCEDVGPSYQCSTNYDCVKESAPSTPPTEQPTSKKSNGESCSQDVECGSNWCDSGYCCKRPETCCRTDDECKKIFTAIPEIICNADYYCDYKTTGKKADGQYCYSDSDCESGNCNWLGSELSGTMAGVCCSYGKKCCPYSTYIGIDIFVDGIAHECAPNYYLIAKGGKKQPCEGCSSNSECASGQCIEFNYGSSKKMQCSAPPTAEPMVYMCCYSDDYYIPNYQSKVDCCGDSDCNSGYKCVDYKCKIGETAVPQITNIIGPKELCGECSSDSDCKSGKCMLWKHPTAGEFKICIGADADASSVMCCSSGTYIQNFKQNIDCCEDGVYAGSCPSGYQCVKNKCQSSSQASLATSYECHFPSCYAELGSGWKCYSHKQEEKGSYCCAGDIQDVPCDQRKKTPEEKLKEKLEEYKKKKPKEPDYIISAEIYLAPPVNELTLRRDEKFTFRLDGINNGTVNLGMIVVGARIEGSAVQAWMENLGPYYGYDIKPGSGIYKIYEEPDFIIKAVGPGAAKLILYITYALKDEKHEITKTIPITVLEENVKSNSEANNLFNKKGMITVKEIKGKTDIKDYESRETKTYDELIIVKDENFNSWEADRMEWIASSNKIAETVDLEGSLTNIVTPEIIGKTNDIKGIMQADVNQKYEDYEKQVIAKTLKSTIIPPLAFDLTVGAYAGSLKLNAFEGLKQNYPKGRFGVVEIKEGTTKKKYDILYYPQGRKAYVMVLAEGKK